MVLVVSPISQVSYDARLGYPSSLSILASVRTNPPLPLPLSLALAGWLADLCFVRVC